MVRPRRSAAGHRGKLPARLEEEARRELDRLRLPLFREMEALNRSSPAGARREPEHLCCLRERNQMRISPLEARDIAAAFARRPELRARLPGVLRRLRAELEHLQEGTRRQGFDCPLLDGGRCLVHAAAKPIGCLAWNPGHDFSEAGWRAFAARDALNDRLHGRRWKLRVIPLWLKRAFARELGHETARRE